MTQREIDGVIKIIFWFVASGNSAAVRQEGTQQEGEECESMWVPAAKVVKVQFWVDDQQVALQAGELFQAHASWLGMVTDEGRMEIGSAELREGKSVVVLRWWCYAVCGWA